MEYKELKEKSSAELESLLKSNREKLRELRFKVAAKQFKNVREVRKLKRTIARILALLLKEKQGKK